MLLGKYSMGIPSYREQLTINFLCFLWAIKLNSLILSIALLP